MVAYLIIIFGLIVIVSGITYNITSDMVDQFLTMLNIGYSQDSRFSLDADNVYGGNLLLTLFKFILIPILFVIIFWVWNLAQKPNRSY